VASVSEQVVHRAVLEHAATRPEAPALAVAGQLPISYQELVAAARTYAAELTDRGVRPGQIVPLLLPRSAQLAAVELAVLMCGAAYANLDVRWPPERHQAVLAMIGPDLVVAPAPTSANTWVPAPTELRAAAARATAFEPLVVDPAAPATVFFTSGTTGVPKGVVIPHRAITRLFGSGGLCGFGPGHATPQAAPAPWDMYAFELWGQLVSGGCTALVAEDHLLPERLTELIRDAEVDTLWLTTSLFNLFVDEDVDCFTGLRIVLTGGERLSAGHVRTFLGAHPGILLRNGYGPAENCMLTTTRLIRPADCDHPDGIPVGTAVPGTSVLLLGEDGRRCPPEVPGEICAAGRGLALGYLGAPESTAQKFPTVEVEGQSVRVYRTGDVGVVDQDGALHFRGRRDRQIKLGGHRIELDEIEVTARRLDGVRECVVLPLAGSDGTVTRLALCYTGNGSAADPAEVRAELAARLPAYLVPAVVRVFDRFPVTANGKIDARELERLARRPVRATRPTRPTRA
jgi:D-alanine--poly(phosphoribitol) ligase subunit 1